MSGKFEKKKGRKSHATLWIVCGLVVLALAAMFFLGRSEPEDPDFTPPTTTVPEQPATEPDSTPAATTAGQEQPAETTVPQTQEQQPAETTVLQVQDSFDLGDGVVITDFISYTGAFMEDRTDEVVSGVLGIRVTNNGEKFIQALDITLTNGDVQAQFSLSTLFPGETVIVLEKNRMAYSDNPGFTQAHTSSVALFEAHPGLCEDKLEIQCRDGVINITNISGEDITGDILIYYKNFVGGIYYGGITYRIRIEGGLKAGEIRQGSAAHFNPDNSAVVFVICG